MLLIMICLQLSNVLLYLQFVFIVFYVSNWKLFDLLAQMTFPKKKPLDSKTLCGILRQKIAGSMSLIMICLQLSSVSLIFILFFLCLFPVRESNVTSIRIGRCVKISEINLRGSKLSNAEMTCRFLWVSSDHKKQQNTHKIPPKSINQIYKPLIFYVASCEYFCSWKNIYWYQYVIPN